MPILDISKTLLYEFLYGNIKPKYQENAKLCYMDTDSFIIHTKTPDFYKDSAGDVEKRYDTSNDEVDRPLPKEINKNVIGLMKDGLRGKIIKEFVALRTKIYLYLTDDDKNVKKAKGTKNCVIKRILKFDDYNDCLF